MAHTHDHANEGTRSQRRLLAALFLITAFALEAVAGWWPGSLALPGDAQCAA